VIVGHLEDEEFFKKVALDDGSHGVS
jgi:hypothetical protein